MELATLLKDPPKLFIYSSGRLVTLSLRDDVLAFIDKHISEKSRTLEIGTGVSTILFAMKNTKHTCIAPDEGRQFELIKDYCTKYNIPLNNIDFKIGKSDELLPSLDLKDLDLILIDGSHAFPITFIDWYYTADKLKIGGLLIIDDTLVWTSHVLKRFLTFQPEWKLVKNFFNTAVFIKCQEFHKVEWNQQPYVLYNSSLDQWRFAHVPEVCKYAKYFILSIIPNIVIYGGAMFNIKRIIQYLKRKKYKQF